MKVDHLHVRQLLPISLEEAWEFFSNPKNLDRITPDDMGFEIVSEPTDETYEGQIIEYRVSPLLGIPLKWVTEITAFEPMQRFVDEMRVGPYGLWRHEHTFQEVEGGVMMEDILDYGYLGGAIGAMIQRPIVKPRVEGIFKYREKILDEIFMPAINVGGPTHKQ